MRIALQTWGTDGDIRPFIALAAGLVARGHTVTLSIASLDDKDYSAMCQAVGASCVRAPERLSIDLRKWDTVGKSRNPLRVLRLFHQEGLFPAWGAMGEAAGRLCEGADLAVGHLFALPLRLAAEQRGVPYASAAFWPGLVPGAGRPPEGFPDFGNGANAWLWRRAFDVLGLVVGGGYRKYYQHAGREPPRDLSDIWYSAQLNLLACSPALWPGAGFAGQHQLCGQWATPAAAEPEPLPDDVEAFLAAGEPPLFLTLGSAGQTDPERSEALLLESAGRTGLRALVQLGEGRPRPRASERVCFVGRTSHAPLLRRCAAALHHGGAGTTHSVLAAGLPAVVLAFTDEQLDWGKRLSAHGAGAGTFRYWSARPAEVARALRKAATDSALRESARALGATVAREDGVAAAVVLLERLAGAKSVTR